MITTFPLTYDEMEAIVAELRTGKSPAEVAAAFAISEEAVAYAVRKFPALRWQRIWQTA